MKDQKDLARQLSKFKDRTADMCTDIKREGKMAGQTGRPIMSYQHTYDEVLALNTWVSNWGRQLPLSSMGLVSLKQEVQVGKAKFMSGSHLKVQDDAYKKLLKYSDELLKVLSKVS